MADNQDSPTYREGLIGMLKEKMYQRLEATVEPGKIQLIKDSFGWSRKENSQSDLPPARPETCDTWGTLFWVPSNGGQRRNTRIGKTPPANFPTQAPQPTGNQLYPDLTGIAPMTPPVLCSPPAYAPSTNPFYPTPVQAPIPTPVQAPMVRGGILDLDHRERDDQLRNLL